MPIVKKVERYVTVAYELMCGFERCTALVAQLLKEMKDEPGVHSAKDDTRGWDGDRMAVACVDYRSLADAIRLDAKVRSILSRNVDFTYEPHVHISYGGRGPESYVTATTQCTPRVPALKPSRSRDTGGVQITKVKRQ